MCFWNLCIYSDILISTVLYGFAMFSDKAHFSNVLFKHNKKPTMPTIRVGYGKFLPNFLQVFRLKNTFQASNTVI
eukprot:TRINITY_DN2254_c1_g1_i1.p1 TRINITY_DN2254_c1_g1~~TRINITY_DN2254_c1_g1_i1.p1  ORF type:complete len:75 (+),score=0.27 TRINITY_DN2254_c1_g1_i1:189-413(+)